MRWGGDQDGTYIFRSIQPPHVLCGRSYSGTKRPTCGIPLRLTVALNCIAVSEVQNRYEQIKLNNKPRKGDGK